MTMRKILITIFRGAIALLCVAALPLVIGFLIGAFYRLFMIGLNATA